MLEALQLPFFQRVLLAALLASIPCGIIGTYVVAKRIASLSGGLAHAAFGGVGLGYLLGFSPMLGAAGFGVLGGVIIGLAYRRLRSGLDTLISMVWAVGMGLGILFVALAPGYAPDLMSYLFGSLLFVPWDYVYAVAALDVAILVAVALFFKEFQAVCFDEEFAEIAGVRVEPVLLGLLALTSLAIVTLIRVVGVILAIALLTIPAAIGRHWADTLRGMMGIATAVSAVCSSSGLLVSYAISEAFQVSLPPGPLIILLAALLYAVSTSLRLVVTRRLASEPT
jgi:zinc transport system permease protein